MNKEQLRSKAKKARLAMSSVDVNAKSQAIIEKLTYEIDWPEVKTVHIYSPIKDLNEVDTSGLVEFTKNSQPQVELTVQDPHKDSAQPNASFDLIIVPVLAFDKNRHRLGWGGGWYDRFLAMQPQALKIGLAYAAAKVPDLPHEPHDIRLDKIITEEGIIG